MSQAPIRCARWSWILAAAALVTIPSSRAARAQDDTANDHLSDEFEDQSQHDPIEGARQARMLLSNAKRSLAEGEKLEKQELAATNAAKKKELHEKAGKAYGEAFHGYQGALKADPKLVDAWVGMGELMAKSGHFDQAIQAFDKALEQRKDDLDALVGKARAQLASFKVADAQASYEAIANKSAKAGREFAGEMRRWLEAMRAKVGPEMHDAVESLDAWLKEREKN